MSIITGFFEACSFYKTKQLFLPGELGIDEHILALEVVDITLDIHFFLKKCKLTFEITNLPIKLSLMLHFKGIQYEHMYPN